MPAKFTQSLKEFSIEVKQQHSANVEMVEDYVYNMVRARSPVDEGVYKANHNRSNDKPDYSYDPEKTSGREPQPTGGKHNVFYVSTGVPYAEAIEKGHSTQHPHPNYGLAYAGAKQKFNV